MSQPTLRRSPSLVRLPYQEIAASNLSVAESCREGVVPHRNWGQRALLACLSWALLGNLLLAADLQVSTEIPGGSADILEIDQQKREIRFALKQFDKNEYTSWWYFKVSGITPGETIRLSLNDGRNSTARLASYSLDGENWQFTGSEKSEGKSSKYVQKVDATEAWFAWYPPFMPSHAKQSVDEAAKRCSDATAFVLTTSEAGHEVPAIVFADTGPQGVAEEDRYNFWFLGRQHAWEVSGSWTAHGLIQWLSSDDPQAVELRRKSRITVVPLIDIDSVLTGRGGKNQLPHDHNRDWHSNPFWRTTRAAYAELLPLDKAGRLDGLIDLHSNGWGAGKGNIQFWCHAYNTMGPQRRRNTDWFLESTSKAMEGPMRFNGKATVLYNTTTPTAGIWACTKTQEHVIGGTFEIGHVPPANCDVPPPLYHMTLGEQLGQGMAVYVGHGLRTPMPESPAEQKADAEKASAAK